MEWLALLLAGGGAVALTRRLGERRSARRRRDEELEEIRRLADEDVTIFGEQLQRLDAEVDGHELDAATRTDYQAALDAYEAAQRRVPRLREPAEVSSVVDTLATGRYALSCVQARVAGREVPERRVPCFFNPQHGPSTVDVLWTDLRRGTRLVPACAQDAARVATHDRPDVRTVRVGGRTVPYWEAGSAYLPYTHGYFPASSTFAGASVAWSTDVSTGSADPGHGHGWWGGGDGSGFGGGDGAGGGDGGGGGF